MTPAAEAAGRRVAGIDLGRLVAIVAVICLHVGFDDEATDTNWYIVVQQVARFAVPFFFVAMGYFSKIAQGGNGALPTALRLLALYLVWLTIHVLVFGIPADHGWRWMLHGGSAIQLWFLWSAALSLVFTWALHRVAGMRGLLIGAALLYATGLITGYYAPFIFGDDLLDVWTPRDGLTFGVPFIAIGVWLSQSRFALSWPAAAALFILAAALQLTEALTLLLLGVSPLYHDFGIATLLLGPAAFLFFRSLGNAAWLAAPAKLGGLAFGVFVVHLAILNLLQRVVSPMNALDFALLVGTVLATSLAVAAALGHTPWLRFLVGSRNEPTATGGHFASAAGEFRGRT